MIEGGQGIVGLVGSRKAFLWTHRRKDTSLLSDKKRVSFLCLQCATFQSRRPGKVSPFLIINMAAVAHRLLIDIINASLRAEGFSETFAES